MKCWIVSLTEDGKWHSGEEDMGLALASYHAIAELRGSKNPWHRAEDRAVETWAIEAPTRYQAIKLAQSDYNKNLIT